ncbi:ACP S-malonyltransferase [uncultured Tateyamaria sp.]|uniref:ACP S-malonyltransferase n=1 Tax=uncultured Tateyamaria sp. TaxID=455651 RepID=UPI002610EA6C|nr:ACP S-malonyltransferase [uncultured Tateyamaria sp.]
MKKTAVVICPGRGTYNKTELGYLTRHHGDQSDLLAQFDAYRTAQDQEALSILDGADRFSAAKYSRGDHASPLIYASSLFDAMAISEDYDVVAVTGNSMGWYIALAVAGAVTPLDGLKVVNTMGTLMHKRLIGGQTLYPFIDDDWAEISGERDRVLSLIAEINAQAGHALAVSIHLGGMIVVAGDEAGLSAFEAAVDPRQGRFPMRLPNHAAFHTALQSPVAAEGQAVLGEDVFASPQIPLVDGRGGVWYPKANTPSELRAYTLGHQVTETYDFTAAIRTAARTFAPDVFICTGPGATLGGAIAQSLIRADWLGLASKAAFMDRQSTDPILISMGREDQRGLVVRS